MRAAIPPLLQYAFLAWCLVRHKDNFTFIFSFIYSFIDMQMKAAVLQMKRFTLLCRSVNVCGSKRKGDTLDGVCL
jgi:hypothetical protein